MTKKNIVALLMIAVAAAFMVACLGDWDKQKCETEYNLVEKGPWEPSTPIIILGKKPGGDGLTQWTHQMPGESPVVQNDSGTSMFSDCTNCSLRDDFIGAKVMRFEYLPAGATDWDTEGKQATKIIAKKGDIKMEITKSFNNIYYRIEDSSSSPLCWCVAYSSLPVDTGEVPSELYEFDAADLQHVGSTTESIDGVLIQTYVLE